MMRLGNALPLIVGYQTSRGMLLLLPTDKQSSQRDLLLAEPKSLVVRFVRFILDGLSH
jgi:hypothetical protein